MQINGKPMIKRSTCKREGLKRAADGGSAAALLQGMGL